MKAIIIENEYEVDDRIKEFLKDFPDLFESVDEQLYCLHRPTASLIPRVLAADAILAASTWMYKDQLKDFLNGFLKLPSPKKVFVYHSVDKLNEWESDKGPFGFPEGPKLIKKLMKQGWQFYDIKEDWDSDNGTKTVEVMGERWSRADYRFDLIEFKHNGFTLKINSKNVVF